MSGQHQNLEVWKKAMDLAEAVHSLSWRLPKAEAFATGNQMRRAAVSIPSNIAEGKARGGKDFIRFLRMANGSRVELETQVQLCTRLKYFSDEDAASALRALEEVGKMLSGLIARIAADG